MKRIDELVRTHPWRGYRMIHGMLRLVRMACEHEAERAAVACGWPENPEKTAEEASHGLSDQGIVRQRATQANEAWSIGFIHDRDDRGRALKCLSVVDEKTRECLSLEVGRSLTLAAEAEILMGLFASGTVPKRIRSDNGPEFIAFTIRRLAGVWGVQSLCIALGSPWENGVVESFRMPVFETNC